MRYFFERYASMTGDSVDKIKSCSVPKALRVNTLKITKQALTKRLAERGVSLRKVSFLENAYYFEAPFSLGSTEEFLLGHYYLQEAASQLPVIALLNNFTPTKNTVICDMAAAPGSKTTQLAAALNNTGKIFALDVSAKRCEALANNLERCGVTNTIVLQKDALHLKDLKIQFDAIILDAPCSGNFSIDKNWLKKRKPEDPKLQAQLQKKLLKAGLAALKPGGFLVYSTCSLEPEEDEVVVASVLSDSIVLCEAQINIGDEGVTKFRRKRFPDSMKITRRLWPHKHNTQGFFIAVFQKVK